MEGIQGAVLEVKLRHLDGWNATRRRIANRYHELLAGTPGLRLPAIPADPAAHVWHLFVVLSETLPRDEVLRQLAVRGISGGVHYPTPVPFQPAYAYLGHKPGDFPVAEDVMRRCFSLPMSAELSDDQVAYAAAALRAIMSD
jgi:dTDP-4-amino-4,6-dideoxygalactose transaminase